MSSGPYQSRLLNLLVRQTRRLRDESGRTLRQLRTTMTWGTQILLYPIYVLFQSSRVIERQFKHTVRQTLPKFQAVQRTLRRLTRPARTPLPPTPDTPLRNTLQAVQALQLPVSIDLNSAIAPSPLSPLPPPSPLSSLSPPPSSPHPTPHTPHPIRAIATHLPARSLVLVTTQNDILDILTPEQQVYVQRRLIWELANYLRYQNQLQSEQRQPPPFLPPPARRPTQLPPVRAFRQLMEWVQRGPVAMTANLFQELTLAHYLLQRDGAIATSSPSSDSLPPHAVAQVTPSRTATPIKSTPQSVIPPLKALKPALPSPWPNLFGKSRWVSMGDRLDRGLDRAIASVEQPGKQTVSSLILSERGMLVQTPGTNPGLSNQTPAEALTVAEQPHLLNLKINPSEGNTPKLNTEPHPATIDTQVTLVEYVKHPLEQLLGWIDRGMLWLETRIARLLTWWRQR